jgi:hypothetical protein
MRPLFIQSRRQKALEILGLAVSAVLIAIGMSAVDDVNRGFGHEISSQPTYASYGYTPDPGTDAVERAVSASIDADARLCRDMHGPNATAQQRPDGSHRCVDKHGKRLSSRSGISIPAHEIAQASR